jgi:hypothetical protein
MKIGKEQAIQKEVVKTAGLRIDQRRQSKAGNKAKFIKAFLLFPGLRACQ